MAPLDTPPPPLPSPSTPPAGRSEGFSCAYRRLRSLSNSSTHRAAVDVGTPPRVVSGTHFDRRGGGIVYPCTNPMPIEKSQSPHCSPMQAAPVDAVVPEDGRMRWADSSRRRPTCRTASGHHPSSAPNSRTGWLRARCSLRVVLCESVLFLSARAVTGLCRRAVRSCPVYGREWSHGDTAPPHRAAKQTSKQPPRAAIHSSVQYETTRTHLLRRFKDSTLL